MSDTISGTCYSMCSIREMRQREKERLLNILEIDEKTKNLKYPKPDPAKIVKCYKRSSAGTSLMEPGELRPGPVLLLTLRYLFTKVLVRTDVKFQIIYEFIFDRIRAIRQDMIVQRLDVSTSIMLLEPIVRFHIYIAERMREKSTDEFVEKFNNQHLLECIKELLVLYDERDSEELYDTEDLSNRLERLTIENNRSSMEAIYLLLYLGNPVTLARGLSLPDKYRKSSDVKSALDISLAWSTRNYVRVCRLMAKLPPLFLMAALNNLKCIRRDSFEIMSCGYNSKSLTVSCNKIKDILLYKDILKVKNDCKLFGLDFCNDNINFQKTKFDNEVQLAGPEKYFSDGELSKLLPNVLFE